MAIFGLALHAKRLSIHSTINTHTYYAVYRHFFPACQGYNCKERAFHVYSCTIPAEMQTIIYLSHWSFQKSYLITSWPCLKLPVSLRIKTEFLITWLAGSGGPSEGFYSKDSGKPLKGNGSKTKRTIELQEYLHKGLIPAKQRHGRLEIALVIFLFFFFFPPSSASLPPHSGSSHCFSV